MHSTLMLLSLLVGSRALDMEIPTPLSPLLPLPCSGPYALCAFANCSTLPGTDPPLTECGCYEPVKPVWYVTPRQLKSQALYNLTSEECFDGDAMNNVNTGCNETDSAPVCEAIVDNIIYDGNYELISTFTPTEHLGQTKCTGPGLMAECMSAACYRKEAFDGSPVTCYCLLVDVPEGQQYGLGRHRDEPAGSCDQPEGYSISGEYTAPISA